MATTNKLRSLLLIFSLAITGVANGQAAPEAPIIQMTPDAPSHELTADVYALVSPREEAKLSSQINAVIASIPFLPGERFVKGDTLIEFECADVKMDIDKIRAELRSSAANVDSNRALAKLGSISDAELIKSESEHQVNQVRLKQRQYELSKCLVKAPFNGEVIDLQARQYELAKTGDPILTIVNNADLELQLFIPSVWLSHLHVGYPFEVFIQETSSTVQASIKKISRRVDPASQSIKVYADIKNPPSDLIAGMSGTADFSVPRTASWKP